MICPKCGQESRNGRTVCALCGTPLKEKRSFWPVLLALLLALAILGAAAWFLWPRLTAARQDDPAPADKTAPADDAAPEDGADAASAAPTPTPEPEPTPAPEDLLWTDVREICALNGCALAIRQDGSVLTAGSLAGGAQPDVADWESIRSLLLRPEAVYGITEDGRVRMTGDVNGMAPAAEWTGIDRLFYSAEALYGLTPEGQLYGAGPRLYFDASVYSNVRTVLANYADTLIVLDDGQVRIIPLLGFFSSEGPLSDVAQVVVGSDHALFRMEDGTVVPSTGTRYNVYEYYGYPDPFADWAGVIDLQMNDSFALGLTGDGHVLCAPLLPYEPFPDTSAWENVTEISLVKDKNLVYGLTSDGRVLSACSWIDGFGSDSWTDVTALQANWYYTVGLTADGRVLVDPQDSENAPAVFDTSEWRGVASIALGDSFLLGLRYDGGVYVTGKLG